MLSDAESAIRDRFREEVQLLRDAVSQLLQPAIKDHVRLDIEDVERFCLLFLDERTMREQRTPARLAFVMRYAVRLLRLITERRQYWQEMLRKFGPDAIMIEA